MLVVFAVGQACKTDDDCPEACYSGRVSSYEI